LLIAGLLLGGAAAPAEAQGHFGLSAGLYTPEDDEADRTETFGLRGGYRFDSPFGVEGSLSRLDLDEAFNIEEGPSIPELDFDFDFELYNLDLSLQWFPGGRGLVVFAGPGLARIDVEFSATFFGQTFSESMSEDIFAAHAGVGYEWQVGERFFLRPEARVRRYFDDELEEGIGEEDVEISYRATDYEVGVLFGWRFGA
jgi:hypothetical protein